MPAQIAIRYMTDIYNFLDVNLAVVITHERTQAGMCLNHVV